MKWNAPKRGEIRTKHKFLLFDPVRWKDEWYWFRWVWITERYYRGHGTGWWEFVSLSLTKPEGKNEPTQV